MSTTPHLNTEYTSSRRCQEYSADAEGIIRNRSRSGTINGTPLMPTAEEAAMPESGLWEPRTEPPAHFAADAACYRRRLLAQAHRLLPTKRMIIIDVFDTFLPKKKRPPELTAADIRPGFVEFLAHFSDRRVVTYSDALSARAAPQWWELLGFSADIDACYGYHSNFDNHVALDGKNFALVAQEQGIDLDDTLIIGDGASEMNVATWYHIDLLRVPPMSLDFPIPFDFRELIC